MLTPDQPVLGQKYRLVRQLETGGMGSVWLAEHVQLNSLVAVKLMGREVAATPAGTQRFLHEARAAASLRSPNVVQILDYGVHEGVPFIAMELLEGESLAARIDREGAFRNWERLERMLRYIARAVARAHDAGIVHRDLKPANIFLVRDEEEEVVKLLDFGIAKSTAVVSASPGSSTRTGEFLGSPTYASPEQLQASKTLDHRADIWSLGVIAYECWIGQPPFVSDTIVGLVLAICMEQLPVPSEHGHVPAGFDAWFARACAREPEHRFQSVREASSELRRLVAQACGLPLPASEPESTLSEALRLPQLGLESAPAVQSPSAAADRTVRQAALARRGTLVAREPGAQLARRSETTRADFGAVPERAVPERAQRRRSSRPLIVALTLLAVVPLLLIALRAVAARSWLDRSVLGLGPAEQNEPVRDNAPTNGDPRNRDPANNDVVPPVTPAVPGVAPSNILQQQSPAVRVASGLRVFSDAPGLELLVDEKLIGQLPVEFVPLEPGEHLVQILPPGPRYSQLDERVVVEAGKVTPFGPVQLLVLSGRASLVPGANSEGASLSLKVGEELRPLPPLPTSVEVETAQPHVLIAERKGYARLELPLVFEDGHAEKNFSVNLTELPPEPTPPALPVAPPAAPKPLRTWPAAPRTAQARLTLTANAPSSVVLDGLPLGTTPIEDIAIEPGVHEITFAHDGERSTERIEIRAGEHKRINANLAPASTSGDGLDEASVQRTIRRYGRTVRDTCWPRTQTPTEQPSVRVAATITVNPAGDVQSVETSGADAYPEVARCVEAKVYGWRFPRARAETVVHVPFVFVTE